jgi:WD40 repeat protein
MNDDNLGLLPERILIDLLVLWEPEAINSVCQVNQRFAKLCRDYVWREKTLLEYRGHFKHWSTAKIDGITDWRQLHQWAHSGFVLQGHQDSVWSVAWSPDGRIASGSSDKLFASTVLMTLDV